MWGYVSDFQHQIFLILAGGPSVEFIDLVQSQHIWMEHVHGLSSYEQGEGWFNVGEIISLMPLEVTCRVLGIQCWVSHYAFRNSMISIISYMYCNDMTVL